MSMRITGASVGIILTAGLTGCAGSSSNPNFQRAGAPNTRLTQPVAATPANNSGWARQPQTQTPATKPAGDPSALAAPTGNTPQFSNQPTGGITPAGGIAPPAVPSAAAPVPAAPAPVPGPSTSNLIPVTPSITTLNGQAQSSATPAVKKPIAVAAVRTADDPPAAAGPIMPPAAVGSDLPVLPPQPITSLTPMAPANPAPTAVRQ